MPETDAREVGLGLVLLAVGAVLVFGPATVARAAPVVLVVLATFVLAAAAVLASASRPTRPA